MSSYLSHELAIPSSPTPSSEFSIDYQLIDSISAIQSRMHSPILVIGEIMRAAEDPIVASSVGSKPVVKCVDESASSLPSEDVEKVPAHGHKNSLRTHERFYFKDGNITFLVCTSSHYYP